MIKFAIIYEHFTFFATILCDFLVVLEIITIFVARLLINGLQNT